MLLRGGKMKERELMVQVGHEDDEDNPKILEVFGTAFLFLWKCIIWLGKKAFELAWAIILCILCQIFPYSSGKCADVEDEGQSGF